MQIKPQSKDKPDIDQRPIILVVVAVAIQAAILYGVGQPPICACGVVRLWAGDILGPENSQQITDWYTPSHVIHGILFYAVLRLMFPKLPLLPVLAMALAIEIAWEVTENSPIIIDRYRQQALAQGYTGDSVLNSVCDTLAMTFGFFLARALPASWTVLLVLVAELTTGLLVRDNLTLNVAQLLAPNPSISAWQAEGGLISAPVAPPVSAPIE